MKGIKNRIAINATFGHEKPTGLGVYTHELVFELLKAECDFDFTVYSSSPVLKKMYPEKVTRLSPLTSPALGFTGHLMRILWQQTMLPIKLRRQNVSLLYSTVPEGILFSPLKQIITMHDILPMKYPEMYPRMKYHFYYTVPFLLKKSQAVICTSENTKKDVTAYYGIKDKTVYVIYEGVNRQRFYPREKGVIQKRYGLVKYLLYIGDMRPYKNLEKSLEAFARLNLTDHTFVIGGRKDPHFYPGLEKKVDRLLLKGKVIFLGYVPEEDLPHLYSDAAAFVFPSLYEGFGLPPLEAMACGCPIVTSRAGSLPEVCGDAVRYVDPYDVENIARGIHEVLTDEVMRQNLRAKGLERAELFSWERSAKSILKFLKNVWVHKTEKNQMKKALITGITGQDGSYLAEFLLEKGYEVHGIVRRSAIEDPEHRMSRIIHIMDRLNIHLGSIDSYPSVFTVVKKLEPNECYHLASQSFVADFVSDEFSTLLTNINDIHNMLSVIKEIVPSCRFYFAASSEMFGNAHVSPQNEDTPFRPRSSYGISKLTGYHLVRNYRESYGLFAVNGILYNHESPRRGFEFVTRKISSHAAKIKLGLAKELRLGNLDARRDWGHAKDYVRAMWMMLQADFPEDYVVGTGEGHSVREFATTAFDALGLDFRDFVVTDQMYYRQREICDLVADSSKARSKLGWDNTYRFTDLVHEMVENDLRLLQKKILKDCRQEMVSIIGR